MSRFPVLKGSMLVVTLVLGIMFAACPIHVQAQSSVPSVRIDPSQIDTLPVGDNFTVYVWIANAANIEAAQVQFTYDSTVLNATNVVEGPFLPSAGNTIVGQATTMPLTTTSTEVQYSSALISGQPAQGTGILVNVTFTVLAEGATTLHLVPFSTATYDGVYFMDLSLNNIVPTLAADSAYGTPITLLSSNALVYSGDTVTFNGALSGNFGTKISNLEVQYRPVLSNTWITLGNTAVDASNSFVYHWTANQTGTFAFQVAYAAGNVTHSSSPIEVVVQPQVHGYGIYVLYAVAALIIIAIAASLLLAFIDRRRKAKEAPPV